MMDLTVADWTCVYPISPQILLKQEWRDFQTNGQGDNSN